jgi:hypothetical protein
VNQTLHSDSQWVLTLTTIQVSGSTLRANIEYRNVGSAPQTLTCPSSGDDTRNAILHMPSGQMVYATSTLCSVNRGQSFTIHPGAILASWAIFPNQAGDTDGFALLWYPSSWNGRAQVGRLPHR